MTADSKTSIERFLQLGFDPDLSPRLPFLEGLPRPTVDVRPDDEAARVAAFNAPFPGYVAPAVDTTDLLISGSQGSVRVRIYRPASLRVAGGFMWVHGGGFAWGDVDQPEADLFSREVATRSGPTVVSVDYRLARDGIHFPIPHNDVYAAWTGIVSDPGLGGPRSRWLLGGASAGANLAAGAALRARDEGTHSPDGLVLIYPFMYADLLEPNPRLAAMLAELPPALRSDPVGIASMRDNYLGGHPDPNHYATPGEADLRGLPETLVVVCEFDDLRPDGERFAQELAAAGSTVEFVVDHGVPHGHLAVPGLPSALSSMQNVADYLTRHLSDA